MAHGTIRLLLVDDSIFFREFLSRALSTENSLEVVGVAADALSARKKILELKPDVVTMDIEMPGTRGTDFLRQIMPEVPGLRVVVISSNPNYVFEALQAGAVDFCAKPNSRPGFDNAAFIKEIVSKIRIAASSSVRRSRPEKAPPPPPPQKISMNNIVRTPIATSRSLIAIGASTGGTEAIINVVRNFQASMPGVVIVQHMPPVFTKMYAERVDRSCGMSVREAQDGDRVGQGIMLIAPGDKHMRLYSDAKGYYVRCEEGPKVSGHMPSVDVLFESVAKVAGKNAVGVILTGMGADGSKGLLQMKQAGAYTFGQNEESCVVYGMPMVAYNLGAVCEQLPLDAIGNAVIRRFFKI